MNIFSIVLWYFLFIVGIVYGVKTPSIPTYEYTALQDLYNSTDGSNWRWRPESELGPIWFNSSNPCDWQGLECTCVGFNCNINRIDLGDHNLHGRLPLSIGNFSQLTLLNFQGNRLTGSLPITIGRLSLLETLYVPVNKLNGTIPEELYDCSNLRILLLLDNEFTGTLSERIGYLTLLKIVYFDNNMIGGTIPSSIGHMVKLVDFNLQNNSVVGTIPREVANCSNLQYFTLQFNDIEGSIPDSITTLRHLKQLSLNGNRISGSLPGDIGNLRNLLRLELTSNRMTGTIPSSIGSMNALTDLYLSDNYFNGTLPSELYKCQSLASVLLTENQFSGSLSDKQLLKLETLSELNLGSNDFSGPFPDLPSSLLELYLNNNNFSSSFPDSFYLLDNLRILDVSGNQITGSISENITQMTLLNTYHVDDNLMGGSLPEGFCNLDKLVSIYMQGNYFSQSIPSCLFEHTRNNELLLYDNSFTGSLPTVVNETMAKVLLYSNQLTGSLPVFQKDRLVYLDVSQNLMSGSVPPELFHPLMELQQLQLTNNLFTGQLPSSMGNASKVQYLDLSYNLLSGTLPTTLSQLEFLSVFYVSNNILTGHIDCFNSSLQTVMTNIELSNNQFGGSLPIEAFRMVGLQTFAAVSNCFTGTVSSEICELSDLTVLALDGLHAASSCRIKLLPSLTKNYALEYWAPGHLPACIFGMPSINTVHICGNGFVGSLPYDMSVGPNLKNIAMSYNLFSGSIPYLLQEVAFDTFDLSYNNFYGLLLPQFEDLKPNSTVYYHVNRLSGRIPQVLRDKEFINILEGNHFQCQFSRDQLPKNDPNYGSYQCGTSSLQRSIYAFLALFLLFAVMILFILMLDRFSSVERLKEAIQWAEQTKTRLFGGLKIFYQNNYSDRMNNITLMGMFMNRLRGGTVVVTLAVIVMFLPTDITLKSLYSTYQYHYAWIVSSINLSGINAAAVLSTFFIVFLVFFYGMYYRLVHNFVNTDVIETSLNPKTVRDNYPHYVWMFSIAVFNLAVVLSVNVGYVAVSLEASPVVLIITQFALAMFKMIWNDIVIRRLNLVAYRLSTRNVTLSLAEERKWKRTYLLFNTYLLIFNVVVVPWMATAAVSPDCFYNVLFEPDDITSTISYDTCTSYEYSRTVTSLIESNCTSTAAVVTTTTFLPPFIYRYQCSSTLVTTYAVLYVYKFVIMAFLQPFGIMYVNYLTQKVRSDSKCLSVLVWFLPPVATQTGESLLAREKVKIFRSDRFNMRLIMYLAIFVTFGVVFPPLAIMACVTVYTQSYFIQLSIGRIIGGVKSDRDRLKLLKALDSDCANVGEIFKKTLYVVGPPAAFFYAFIVFDIYGDAVGGHQALWLALVIFVLGLIITSSYSYAVSREVIAPVKPRVYSVDKIQMQVFNSVFRDPNSPSSSPNTSPGPSPTARQQARPGSSRLHLIPSKSRSGDQEEEDGEGTDGIELGNVK